MKKKTKITIVTAAVIVLAVLAIFFISNGKEPAVTVPDGAKVGEIILEPEAYKTDSVDFSAERGILVVPESRGTDSQRLIALPITCFKSTADEPSEPIFYLSGGPGMSNMDFKPPPELLANHDVVLVGYRGVDGSVVLDCPNVKQAFKGDGTDLLGQESLDALREAFQKDAAQLQVNGIDLDAYTMLDVIADIEVVRTALGYEQINLLSLSYGTRIAQIYAYKHPDNIYRSVMIAVNTPGRFVWEPDTIDSQLEYYSRLYAEALGIDARTQDLAETMRNVMHDMPSHWLFLPIDAGKVRVTANAMLFHRDTASMVFDAFIAAEQGDPSGLALMSLAYDFMMPSMFNWGDLASKAVSADLDPSRDYSSEMDPPGSIIGAPMSKVVWTAAVWPTAAIPDEYRKVQTSDVETLLVSGSVDFSTPAEHATNELLPFLNRGQLVLLKEMGHTGDLWGKQQPAMMRLLTSFYDTGVVDDSLYTYAPMEFSVSMGFPLIAKLALGFMVVLLLVIALVAWRIVRRIQHRRM